MARMSKIAVASSSYEHGVCEQALPKKFAAQATPGTGRGWPVGNTTSGEDLVC